MAASDQLNPRQELFVREYLIDLNATAAYIRAGYKARGHAAEAAAHKLLRKAEVTAAVELATAERCQRLQLTADDVLEELAHIGRSDLGHVLDFTGDDLRLRPVREIPVAVRRTISSVKVRRRVQGCGEDARAVEVTEFKLWDKIAALDKIGKHLGLFIDRHEHTGPDGQPLQIEFIDLISAPAAPATGPGDGR